MLTSLGTGNAGSYVCGVSVAPINTQYITGPMGSNAAILGTVSYMLFSHTHHLSIFNFDMVVRQRELELKYITESVECHCSLIWYKLLMSSKHEFFY